MATTISLAAYMAAVEGRSGEEILSIGTPLLEAIIVDASATDFEIRLAKTTLDNITGIYAPFAEREKL